MLVFRAHVNDCHDTFHDILFSTVAYPSNIMRCVVSSFDDEINMSSIRQAPDRKTTRHLPETKLVSRS
jgi:hypothetical protein